MAIRQKRDKPLKILMTETTHQRLVDLGDLLGQSPGTLASMAVSEFVNKYMGAQRVQDQTVKAMVDHLGPQMTEQLKLMAESSK